MADVATFEAVFPEFVNMAGTTQGGMTFWLAQAQNQLALGVLGANADLAVYLYMAHNLVLGAQEAKVAASGALPGDTLGPIASKSAGGLSVSYDTAMIAMEGAGPYNATSYGQRLWKLLQAASLGGVYRSIPTRPHVYRGGFD